MAEGTEGDLCARVSTAQSVKAARTPAYPTSMSRRVFDARSNPTNGVAARILYRVPPATISRPK